MNQTVQDLITIIGGQNRVTAMVGATNWAYSNEKNYIQFKFKMCKKANICKVEYNEGHDLIDLVFYKYNKKSCECKEVKRFNELFFDQVQTIFEEYTGLYLSL